MSKNVFINSVNRDLDFPQLKIIQFSFTTNRSWDNPNRTAPFWRFYWSETPGAYIVFRERKIELTSDKVLLIAPNIRYASYSVRPFRQLYMHFEWKMSPVPVEPLTFSSLPMEKLFSSVGEWFEQAGEFFTMRMHAILFYYLSKLPAARSDMRCIDPRIIAALSQIDQHLELSNGGVARKVNMSCDNFQRIFKKEIGLSPCQYRTGRRMEQAQHLLQNTDLSMDEIALECGFMNRYQFSKAYKLFFKTTPASDRKKRFSAE